MAMSMFEAMSPEFSGFYAGEFEAAMEVAAAQLRASGAEREAVLVESLTVDALVVDLSAEWMSRPTQGDSDAPFEVNVARVAPEQLVAVLMHEAAHGIAAAGPWAAVYDLPVNTLGPDPASVRPVRLAAPGDREARGIV